MPKSKETATAFLKYLYYEINLNQGLSSKIRNWCITVWMASIAVTYSDKIILNEFQKMVFPFMPILIFWLLDAFQNTFISLNKIRAAKVELAMAYGTLNSLTVEDCCLHAGYSQFSTLEKLAIFIKCLVVDVWLSFKKYNQGHQG